MATAFEAAAHKAGTSRAPSGSAAASAAGMAAAFEASAQCEVRLRKPSGSPAAQWENDICITHAPSVDGCVDQTLQ